MATSAPLFPDLPIEILHLILSTFCLHCRAKDQVPAPDAYFRGTQQQRDERSWYSLERHTLFSICLVSKRLCDVAQPFLYHEFVPGYGDSWRSTLYTWDGRLTSFMRTVAQRPDLAALVKRVYIHSYLLESVDDEEARNTLEQIGDARGIKFWRQWSTDDLVTVLISELPNLEHLSIQDDGSPLNTVLSSDLLAAGVSDLPLKTIDITLRAFANSIVHNFLLNIGVLGIFELATGLETLNLHMCGGFQESAIPSLPNLKTLRITHSRLDNEDIERLLASCVGLQSFFYETARTAIGLGSCGNQSPMPLDPSINFQLSHAKKHLSRHRGTLKFLHLDLRGTSGPQSGNTITFKDFTALEHLFLNLTQLHKWQENEMPPEIYYLLYSTPPPPENPSKKEPHDDPQVLVRLLPHDIVELHLTDRVYKALPDFVKSLLALADAVSQGQFPRLKRIRCEKFDDDAVGAMFAAAGVDFGYCSWPLSDTTLQNGDIQPPPTSWPDMPLPDSDDPDL